MIFQNTSIDIQQLPKAEEVDFQKPARDYLTVNYIGNFILFGFLLIPLLIFWFFSDLIEHPLLSYGLPILWLTWFIISSSLVQKSYDLQGYALRERDILFRKGVIFRKITAIPFNRVQHCEIQQGPVERAFGLRTLKVYTAGGQSSDLSIPGLLSEEAAQLKAFIVQNTAADGET